MIKKEGSKFVLFSKDGTKKLGTFDTKAEAEKQEANVNFFKNKSQLDMVITKASLLKDGTMRFHATCSDTEQDSREEHTTKGLFVDWMQRIEQAQTVPFLPPPRIPFLSIAHYSSLNGLGEAGVIEKGYIDGKAFKVSGYFYNDPDHPCGPALFSAVQEQQELVQKGEPIEEPIRISAAWWDLAHSHGDFIFERKSLTDKCSMCEEGSPRTFLKGQLDHMAATRVPINPRTSLELEELSEIKTRREDASSMIGDELAELLDKAYKSTEQQSETLVSLSEELVERAFGGAMTFEEAEKFLDQQEEMDKVWSNFDMFMTIVDNIIFTDDDQMNKVEVMRQAVSDFGSRISALQSAAADQIILASLTPKAIGDITMPDETVVIEGQDLHPAINSLQAAVAPVLADSSLDRSAKYAAIQPALEAFASDIKNEVEVSTPVDLKAELSDAMAPVLTALELIASKMGAAQAAPVQQPVQRSYVPGRTPEPAMPNNTSSITNLIRKSVGIQD